MAFLLLTVKKDDGSEAVVPVRPSAVVAFERHFQCGLLGNGAGGSGAIQKMEHLYWLAWEAEHADGRVRLPFDDWLSDVLDVEVAEEPPLAPPKRPSRKG